MTAGSRVGRYRSGRARGAVSWLRRDPVPPAVLAAGLSTLLAAVTVLVVQADPARAQTVVVSARDAVLVPPGGVARPARAGTAVPRGATVQTAAGGAADLRTAGRDVLVGGGTAVAVLDGVRQRLDAGQVFVDVRRGPALVLAAVSATVRLAAGSLARVEQGTLLRVGLFRGRAAVTPLGRRLTTALTALHQVQVADGVLPGPATALALRDDGWEQQLARSLVAADLQLTDLAAGLAGSSGSRVLAAAPAAFRWDGPASDRMLGAGEGALQVVLAEAAHSAGSPSDHRDLVRRSRAEGGSWAVVAALVAAPLGAVSGLLDGALAPGTVLVRGPSSPPGPAGAGPAVRAGGSASTGRAAGPGGRVPVGPAARSTPVGPGPTPSPAPRPTSSAGTVQGVVDTLLGALPSGSPLPTVGVRRP